MSNMLTWITIFMQDVVYDCLLKELYIDLMLIDLRGVNFVI